MANIIVISVIAFLVYRGFKAGFSQNSACGGSCASCRANCAQRKQENR